MLIKYNIWNIILWEKFYIRRSLLIKVFFKELEIIKRFLYCNSVYRVFGFKYCIIW